LRHQHEKRGAGRPPVSRLARAAGHPDDPGATPTIAGRSSRRRQRSGAQLVSLVLVRTDGVDVAVVGVGSLAVGVGIGLAYGARCRRDRRRKAQLCVLKDLRAAALAATSAPGPGLTPATSALRPGSPPPHLHRDRTHPCHICTGTGLRRWAVRPRRRIGTRALEASRSRREGWPGWLPAARLFCW
jgi:hypothetical protein